MNGFQARDFPPGFQPQQHQNHLLHPQHQHSPRPSLSPNNHWLNPMQPNPHPHFNQQQQPQLNSAWMNQMQQFSSGMSAMGFNPLIQQQLFQDALAMSQPVEAADEPLIVQVLLSAKKKKESYKEALNNLHGVSALVFTLISSLLIHAIRETAIPLVSGKTTISTTRTTSTLGSTCASRRKSLTIADHLPTPSNAKSLLPDCHYLHQ